MRYSSKTHKPLEFLCPDCGCINQVSTSILDEKYREHQVKCQNCNHLLEIVVTDGLGNSLNVVASSTDDSLLL